MALIDEQALPRNPVEAEVVLHVRKHLRRRIRQQPTHRDLSLFFGLSEEECRRLDMDAVLQSHEPLAVLADQIAKSKQPVSAIVSLPVDGAYVEKCRQWLLDRKRERPAVFDSLVATDLGTLLALSQARDAATIADKLGGDDLPEVPVLITGETGTGKEMLARAIHELWIAADPARQGLQLQSLFVAGMSKDQVNDELFGHVKGAYTDAKKDRPGRLEVANGTTLLIDEVGDLSPEAQVRLLRFLDRGEVSRLGSNNMERVKVRIIAATLKRLEAEVEAGRFRRDLLYRLRGIQIQLPALRDRTRAFDDVVSELLERVRPDIRPQLTRSARAALRVYPWPGNLRELRQVLNAAVASAEKETIQLEDLPAHLRHNYWAIPFEQRAGAFLCDETRRQPLTTEIAIHRASTVRRYLETLPSPASTSDATATYRQIQDFLESIPDDSQPHQESLQNIADLISMIGESRRLFALARHWQTIAEAGLPTLAQECVERELTHARTQAKSAERELLEASKQFRLEENPWWTLWNEIRSLPILHGIEGREELRAIYSLATRLMMSMPQEVREQLQLAIHERKGLRGVWEVLKDIVQTYLPDDPTPSYDEYISVSSESDDAIKPRDRPPEFWQELAASSSTVAEAAKKSGYDPKTVGKYFSQYDLSPDDAPERED